MMAHTHRPSASKVMAGGPRIDGHLCLHSEWMGCINFMKVEDIFFVRDARYPFVYYSYLALGAIPVKLQKDCCRNALVSLRAALELTCKLA